MTSNNFILPRIPIFPEWFPTTTRPGRQPPQLLTPRPEISPIDIDDLPPALHGSMPSLPPIEPGKPSRLDKYNFPSVDEISQYVTFRKAVDRQGKLPVRFWGFIVSEEGWRLYTAVLNAVYASSTLDECSKAAWRFIVTHQTHHFLVDRAVAAIESVFALVGFKYDRRLWENFHGRFSPRDYSPLEESSCCAYSLRKAGAYGKYFWALTCAQQTGYQNVARDGKTLIAGPPELTHLQAVDQLLAEYFSPNPGARLTNLHGLVLYSDSDSDTKGGRAVTNGYYSFVPQIYIAP